MRGLYAAAVEDDERDGAERSSPNPKGISTCNLWITDRVACYNDGLLVNSLPR